MTQDPPNPDNPTPTQVPGPTRRFTLPRLRWALLRKAWHAHGPQAVAAILAATIGALQLRGQVASLVALRNAFGKPGVDVLLKVFPLLSLPRVLLGLGLVLMAFALLTRARVAWLISLLLALFSAGLALARVHGPSPVLVGGAALIFVLIFYARRG